MPRRASLSGWNLRLAAMSLRVLENIRPRRAVWLACWVNRVANWRVDLQSRLPLLDFTPMLARERWIYPRGIHAVMGRDYQPLVVLFEIVIVSWI